MSLTPFYYAFLAPVALIMFVNIIVYVLVVVNICRRGNNISSSGIGKRHVGIRASVACFIALGNGMMTTTMMIMMMMNMMMMMMIMMIMMMMMIMIMMMIMMIMMMIMMMMTIKIPMLMIMVLLRPHDIGD
jgi:hypothetical protein